MEFNGAFMTANRKWSFTISTPTSVSKTSISIKSAFGEMMVNVHIFSYRELEGHMMGLARLVGGHTDPEVIALARTIGSTK